MRRALLLAAAVTVSACNDTSRSPVGADLLPGGVLGGGLQVVTLRDVERAEDYAVFPAGRGSANRLVTASEWPVAPGVDSRALVRFSLADLDSLPDDIRITDAGLRLAFGPPPPEPVTLAVHRLTNPWNEDAATWGRRDFGVPWATPGGDFEPAPVAVFTIQPAAPDSADSTALVGDSIRVPLDAAVVEGWLSGAAPNNGLILVQQTPGLAVNFASREGAGSGNPLGPRLEIEVLLPDTASPAFVTRIAAAEDTFIAIDQGALAPGGLVVSAGGEVRRAFILPELEDFPAGATIIDASLIVSVDETRLVDDSLRFIAREVVDGFRGEKTVLSRDLGVTEATTAAVDSLVFESRDLTEIVRRWIRDPETNHGIVLHVLDESTAFGGVRFSNPRLRLLVIPPAVGDGVATP